MAKVKEAMDVYAMIADGEMELDEFMCWVSKIKSNAESNGYKQGCEQAYKMGNGGHEF